MFSCDMFSGCKLPWFSSTYVSICKLPSVDICRGLIVRFIALLGLWVNIHIPHGFSELSCTSPPPHTYRASLYYQSLFFYQLMHNLIVLKTILKFTLKLTLTHRGRVMQICVFNTHLFSLHNKLNYAILRACLRMVLLMDVCRNLTSLWINL